MEAEFMPVVAGEFGINCSVIKGKENQMIRLAEAPGFGPGID